MERWMDGWSKGWKDGWMKDRWKMDRLMDIGMYGWM